jgi:hypothetical protein
MVHLSPNVVISMGKWLKSLETPTNQPFPFIFAAMIIFYTIKIFQFDAGVVRSGTQVPGK